MEFCKTCNHEVRNMNKHLQSKEHAFYLKLEQGKVARRPNHRHQANGILSKLGKEEPIL